MSTDKSVNVLDVNKCRKNTKENYKKNKNAIVADIKREMLHDSKRNNYKHILEGVNSLITLRRFDILHIKIIGIQQTSLTAAQKKYLLHKITNAEYKFYYTLESGNLYVWNLPSRLRYYKAYLGTLRYIKYCIIGKKQLRLASKLLNICMHDNGVGIYLSMFRKNSILSDLMHILFPQQINKEYVK